MDNFEQKMKDIAEQVYDEQSGTNQFAVSTVPFHTHNGSDSPRISFTDLTNRNEFINILLPGFSGQTQNNWGVVFTAPYNCSVIGATEVHQTAESTASRMTVQIEKLTGTQASGAGVQLLFSLPGITGVAVASGGGSYAVNDTITLTGGTGTVQAILKVTSITGSAVATVSIQNAGTYTAFPTNPVAQGSSSGSGTGATFNISFVVPGFDLKATANTVQTAILNPTTATNSAFNLQTGDRIGLVLATSGSAPATLVGVVIIVQLSY